MIDWQHFTPYSSLIGGAILGLASGAAAIMLGRIVGISGILTGLLKKPNEGTPWFMAFTVGLLLSPWLYSLFKPLSLPTIQSNIWLLAVAGLLVGIGTKLGSGCTSGHGICGLSRFSLRSLVGTLCFMATGFIVVFVMRHMI